MSNSTDITSSEMNSGDVAWVLTSSSLVFMMTPALAFFYGGLVDHKNIINQLFLSFVCMGVISIQWILFGYSFAFGPGSSSFGSFDWSVLRFDGSSTNYDQLHDVYATTFPLLLHVLYQMAFAVITPAIISGAIVGRMKFKSYLIFIFLWSTIVYDPLAKWVWGSNGWLRELGAIDFAGGTVIHISSGFSALVASLILGPRQNWDRKQAQVAHNVPFTVLGAGLLWIGWTGFNGGSALAANGLAVLAFINTMGASASALVTWVALESIFKDRPSLSGAAIGAVVGLVVVTPACGFIHPGWSILLGFIGAGICYSVLQVKHLLHVDDTLDVFTCHGIGGVIGALLTGLFADKLLNPAGADGAFYGGPILLWYQLVATLTTIAYSMAVTAGILLLLKFTIGLRCDKDEEALGLDEIAHGESWVLAKTAHTSVAKINTSESKSERKSEIKSDNNPADTSLDIRI